MHIAWGLAEQARGGVVQAIMGRGGRGQVSLYLGYPFHITTRASSDIKASPKRPSKVPPLVVNPKSSREPKGNKNVIGSHSLAFHPSTHSCYMVVCM